jgi:hypothetical protein
MLSLLDTLFPPFCFQSCSLCDSQRQGTNWARRGNGTHLRPTGRCQRNQASPFFGDKDDPDLTKPCSPSAAYTKPERTWKTVFLDPERDKCNAVLLLPDKVSCTIAKQPTIHFTKWWQSLFKTFRGTTCHLFEDVDSYAMLLQSLLNSFTACRMPLTLCSRALYSLSKL